MSLALPLGFLLGFFGSVPIAGPIAVMVVAYGVSNRIRSGLYLAAGGAVAESFYAFIAFWGFAELVRRYAFVVSIANGVAALVFVVLGCWFFSYRPSQNEANAWQTKSNGGGTFLLGFTVTALNPTLLLTWTGAVSTLSSFRGGWLTSTHALPFAIGTFGGIVSWFALLLGGIRRYQRRLASPALRYLMRSAGILLVALGIWFATKLVTHLYG